MLQLSSIKGRITMVHKLYAYYTCACTTLSSSSCFFEAKLVLDVYISDDGRITSLNGSLLSLHLGERERVLHFVSMHEYYINVFGEFHWLNVTNHVKYECSCCKKENVERKTIN